MRPCPDCGRDLDMVGRAHRCVANNMANGPMANTELANMSEIDLIRAANEPAPIGQFIDGAGNTYRYRDAEKRRTYMREYMRKKRAVR